MRSLLVSISLLAGALAKVRVTDVHSFNVGTWSENLAVRDNGQILATFLTAPEIMQVDPAGAGASLVTTIPKHLSTLGITEGLKDIFYVIAGNVSITTGSFGPHTQAIYKVDVSKFVPGKPVTATLVTLFHEAALLNGLTTLNAEKGLILAADSLEGLVWKLDVNTGVKEKIIDIKLMKKTTMLGINGIKVRDGHVFWTNLDQGLVAKIPISATGAATGPATVISRHLAAADDLILVDCADLSGHLKGPCGFVAGDEQVRAFSHDAEQTISMNNLVNGSTAVQLGKTGELFVSTNGNNNQYSGTITKPGKIVKILFS